MKSDGVSQLLIGAFLVLALFLMSGCLATHDRQRQSGPGSPCRASQPADSDSVAEEEVESFMQEKPGPAAWEGGFYSCMGFGEIGRRIVTRWSPEDLALLKACLMRTDGPRTFAVNSDFPVRGCDYALMIAENLPGERFERTHKYSFGPGTPYEHRDSARYEILKRRFGVEPPAAQVLYEYLDENGRSVAEEYRKGNGFP